LHSILKKGIFYVDTLWIRGDPRWTCSRRARRWRRARSS
jgi:hypothetical protein